MSGEDEITESAPGQQNDAFHIGSVRVWPPVVLAPMEGVTDRAYRTTIRSLGGCGMAVTEFVSSEGLTRDVQNAWRMAELDPDEKPVSIQIYGRDPERMAESARFCRDLGADVVDINLGCPSKRVTSGCSGSALMKEPERAADIFAAVFDAIEIPMTVKMRLGWDEDSLNAPQIARLAVDAGAQMIAVHGRTRMQAYKRNARWDEIRAVRDAVGVPLLVNGDIFDGPSAVEAMRLSGADGVMVGRATMSDPWALARIAAHLAEREFVEPDVVDRLRALLGYLRRMDGEDQGRRTMVKVKRVVGFFTKGLPHVGGLRRDVQCAHSVDDARALVMSYFGAYAEHYAATDLEDVLRRTAHAAE